MKVPPILEAFGGWTDANWLTPRDLSDTKKLANSFTKIFGRGLVADTRRLTTQNWYYFIEDYHPTFCTSFRTRYLILRPDPLLEIYTFPVPLFRKKVALEFQRLASGRVLGCVTHYNPDWVNLLFWHKRDTHLTASITSLSPEYPMPLVAEASKNDWFGSSSRNADHGAANEPSMPQPEPEIKQPTLSDQEKQRLLHEIADLQERLTLLKNAVPTPTAMQQLRLDDARLKSMLRLVHPDYHKNSKEANEAAVWINNLREALRREKPV